MLRLWPRLGGSGSWLVVYQGAVGQSAIERGVCINQAILLDFAHPSHTSWSFSSRLAGKKCYGMLAVGVVTTADHRALHKTMPNALIDVRISSVSASVKLVLPYLGLSLTKNSFWHMYLLPW